MDSFDRWLKRAVLFVAGLLLPSVLIVGAIMALKVYWVIWRL